MEAGNYQLNKDNITGNDSITNYLKTSKSVLGINDTLKISKDMQCLLRFCEII